MYQAMISKKNDQKYGEAKSCDACELFVFERIFFWTEIYLFLLALYFLFSGAGHCSYLTFILQTFKLINIFANSMQM